MMRHKPADEQSSAEVLRGEMTNNGLPSGRLFLSDGNRDSALPMQVWRYPARGGVNSW